MQDTSGGMDAQNAISNNIIKLNYRPNGEIEVNLMLNPQYRARDRKSSDVETGLERGL